MTLCHKPKSYSHSLFVEDPADDCVRGHFPAHKVALYELLLRQLQAAAALHLVMT